MALAAEHDVRLVIDSSELDQAGDEPGREVAVGIDEPYVRPTGFGDADPQGRTLATILRKRDQSDVPLAEIGRNVLTAVGASVRDGDHFEGDAGGCQHVDDVAQMGAEPSTRVEEGDDDAESVGVRLGHSPVAFVGRRTVGGFVRAGRPRRWRGRGRGGW